MRAQPRLLPWLPGRWEGRVLHDWSWEMETAMVEGSGRGEITRVIEVRYLFAFTLPTALCSCDLKCNSTGSLPCCTNCTYETRIWIETLPPLCLSPSGIARCSCATNCVSRHNCCFFCSKGEPTMQHHVITSESWWYHTRTANCYCDVLCSLTQPKSCCSFCPNGPSGLLHKCELKWSHWLMMTSQAKMILNSCKSH